MVKLKFTNYDTCDDESDIALHTIVIECSIRSVRNILAWYGAFHAGDDYFVQMDGQTLAIDINGELIDFGQLEEG